MIKHDIGQLGAPFFEQKLENGVNLIFLPRKSTLKSAMVYVAHGGYYRTSEVMGVKTPFGSAYYLEHMLMSDKFKDELAKKGVLGYSHTDFSFSYYGLNTLGDLYSGLSDLMDRISFGTFTEEDVEAFKEKERLMSSEKSENPLDKVEKKALDNLYFESPIKKGVKPNQEQANVIHASGLKKFLEAYYVPSKITILVAMEDNPRHFMDEIKKLHFPSPLTIYEKQIPFREIYDKPRQEFDEFVYPSDASYLSYAVKMPSRKALYDNYGEMLFSLYEVLEDVIFRKNPDFRDGLRKNNIEFVKTSLSQGFEDCYLMVDVKCTDPNAALSYITGHLSHVSKHVDSKLFKSIKDSYYAQCQSTLAVPSKALIAFTGALANNLSYPTVVNSLMKMSFSYLKNYLGDFETFRRAASFLRKA